MTLEAPAVVEVTGLTLRVRGQILLEDAGLEIRQGEIVLLVGASGTGKSLTLALLAGLPIPTDAVELSGSATILGRPAGARRGRHTPGAGLVFQDFALFDDLTARQNVRFGADHASVPEPDPERLTTALLAEFDLPGDERPARLSGGMKQRLAVSRAMATCPEVLLYDEPTSGLDPAMSRRVARAIREVHDRHGMTTVVVTHDLPPLVPIADRVLLLDPVQRRFRDVSLESTDAALETLTRWKPVEKAPAPRARSLTRIATSGLEAAGDMVIAAGRSLAALVPRFPSPAWGARFFWRFLALTSLGSALPFLLVAGLIAGFVTAYFMWSLLPVRGFTEPVLTEEFIGSLGYSLYRVVVPGVVTMLFAARSGAALAADLGNRQLSRQVDFLRSLGIDPRRYLLTSSLWASLLGIPILFVLADWGSRLAALGVFLATHPGHGSFAFREDFGKLLGGEGWLPGGTGYVLGKLLLAAFGTAAIAYHMAMRPKTAGSDVARAVTGTIIRATLFVLVVHLIFAFFEF